LAVSRNVMREIVRMLSARRLIDAQPYHGLFVMPRAQWDYLDADVLEWVLEKKTSPTLIRSLIEVRSLIEPTISRWTAERATAVDLVDIEASFNQMAASRGNAEAFHEADISFHHAVLVASHNLVIQQLSNAVGALQRAIFDFTFEPSVEHMDRTLRQHHDLLDAIRRKNPEVAEETSRYMMTYTAGRAIKALTEVEAST
jgi:GntR family galactonate operon transcriptional repressor